MRLHIDFYSKDEITIQTDLSQYPSFEDEQKNDVFLFTCYTLRQLWNFGQDIVMNSLAGMLVSRDDIDNLFKKEPTINSCDHLLFYFKQRSIELFSETIQPDDVQKVLMYIIELDKKIEYAQSLKEALDREILSRMPKFVKYNGPGKKSFYYSLPLSSLNQKGFGILGFQVNYYGFHSIVGVLRFLGNKYYQDKEFVDRLSKVALECGNAYIMNRMSVNQGKLIALGTAIINSAYE